MVTTGRNLRKPIFSKTVWGAGTQDRTLEDSLETSLGEGRSDSFSVVYFRAEK